MARRAWGTALPVDPNAPYRVYRSTFITRMDVGEVAQLETVLQEHENAKLRQMFYAVEYFVSNDPLFAVLHWTVATALGSMERADVLMGPET